MNQTNINEQNVSASPCHTGILELLTEATDDFQLVIVPYIAAIAVSDDPERICDLRLWAIKEMQQYLWHYKKLGYMPKLLCAIARKKCEMLLTLTTKAEIERLIKPRSPQYNGNQFIPDKFSIPEEELICWSETSLRAPLNEAGFKRYLELFRQVFPEESRALPV